MTEELVISAFEACADFSGDEVCARCGWLEHEHEHESGQEHENVMLRAA